MTELPIYELERKLDELTKILEKQIKRYVDHKKLEKEWELDKSFIYDTAIEQFEDISRWDAVAILKNLSEYHLLF